MRLVVTDSNDFVAAVTSQVVVFGADGSGQELIDYALDPGFESGANNFENYYEVSTTELVRDDPIEGASSLAIFLPGWANTILPITYPFGEGPSGYSLIASVLVRVDKLAPESSLELCAVGYWDTNGTETRHESCTQFSEMGNEAQRVDAILELDGSTQLTGSICGSPTHTTAPPPSPLMTPI